MTVVSRECRQPPSTRVPSSISTHSSFWPQCGLCGGVGPQFAATATLLAARFLSRRAMPSLAGVNSRALKNGDPEPPLEAGKVRVYSMRFCPWAERALIYLAAKEIPAEVVNIDLQKKPDWYFKKHPQGKVPAFEHDGKVVIESGIIPEYLDAVYPKNPILPSDPYERALQRVLVDQLASVPQAFYGLFAALKDPSVREEKVEAAEKTLDDVEQRLLVNNFFAGSKPGYADYLVLPFFERIYLNAQNPGATNFDAKDFPGHSRYPKLTKWFNAVYNSPAVQAVAQPPAVSAEFFKSYVSGNPNYDAGI